ncbi:hypothetical protein HOD38_02445 [archaeon]|jgi:hypothetical protein|nr:hypothetical protein [archaeon]MBT4397102.1 hypothetical protein [archaeon]MBT4441171.1 hypothetical protein [archaeon]
MVGKTRDGLRLSQVVRTLESIPGVSIRSGTNKNIIALMEGHPRCCPIDRSTHARRTVVPWLKAVTGYESARDIYDALRSGNSLSYVRVPTEY